MATASFLSVMENKEIERIVNNHQKEDAQFIANRLSVISEFNGNNDNSVITVLKFSDNDS